jgi:hypothetical protein
MLSRLPVGALKKTGAFGAATRSTSVSFAFEQRKVPVMTCFSNIQQVRFASSSTAPNTSAFQVNRAHPSTMQMQPMLNPWTGAVKFPCDACFRLSVLRRLDSMVYPSLRQPALPRRGTCQLPRRSGSTPSCVPLAPQRALGHL